MILILAIYFIQIGVLLALLVVGGKAVVKGEVAKGCQEEIGGLWGIFWMKSVAIPVDVVVGGAESVVTVTKVQGPTTSSTFSTAFSTIAEGVTSVASVDTSIGGRTSGVKTVTKVITTTIRKVITVTQT
jgi:hypothetical protein